MNIPLVVCGTGVVLAILGAASAFFAKREPAVIRIKGLRWTRHQLCQHVLITGATGSGKTRSGIVTILLQLFRNDRTFGGLFVDEKGVLHETVIDIARHNEREKDILLLEIKPNPTVRFNLIGVPDLPFSTLAQCVVDTAVAMGNRNEQSFFRNAAQIHIAKAMEVLKEANLLVSLDNVHELLTKPTELENTLRLLKNRALIEHFQQYLAQPPEQLGGITGTVQNYLSYFTKPEIAEVFCRTSTFQMRDLDQGKLVCLSIPQLYRTERRFVGTFLKLLFYNHALTRYDMPQPIRAKHNLLVLVVDECQHFVTKSEQGMSDHNVIDIVREAKLAVIATTQSTTSLVPVIGQEESRVYTLNLRTRLIFKAADEQDAKASADFISKEATPERSTTAQAGAVSESLRMIDEYRIKPSRLMRLRQHQCVIVHPEDRYRKVTLPPREADGTVSKWYRRFFFSL